MAQYIAEGSLDLALLLTEGAIAAITNGNPSRIIGTWVDSPLTWGIHAKAGREPDQLPDLSDGRYAISRYGSGSHLMAIINCQLRGRPLATDFEVVGSLDGARTALAAEQADFFMWEQYTTQFLVDQGEFQRIDHCDTPWPCFVLVATEQAIDQNATALVQLLNCLQQALATFPVAAATTFIEDYYQLKPDDVSSWAERVSWSAEAVVSPLAIEQAVAGLLAASVIEQAPAPNRLVADFVQMVEVQ